MTADDPQNSGVEAPQHLSTECDQIIIGIHGVGSPPIGAIAENILRGYAGAHPCDEIKINDLVLSINNSGNKHVYRGLRFTISNTTAQIWEVNWSDLKGFPGSAIGTAFYALKSIVAMVQISDRGWDAQSRGVTGPLFFGALLRSYFCIFSLVAPLNLLLIEFAYIQANRINAFVIILGVTIFVSAGILRLKTVDRLVGFSLFFLGVGVFIATWVATFPSDKDLLLRRSIEATGIVEGLLGAIVFCGLVELLIRYIRANKSATPRQNASTFAARSGMMILGVAIGAAAYGAFVNAIGFYLIKKIFDWDLAIQSTFDEFGKFYLKYIGYDVAQMELIHGATTFGVGAFLVVGTAYYLVRISLSSDLSSQPMGKFIQNWFDAFLWITLAAFLFLFVVTVADVAFFTSSESAHNPLCSIYGIQWLLCSKRIAELNPIQIYAASAARIVPFILPVLIPPLRAGLNTAADVLLYILPSDFPFSLETRAKERFRGLLTHLQTQHPDANLSILAHSQGTVIVRDVLSKNDRRINCLITAGSPLASLYSRFLDRSVEALPNTKWTNIYRLSDYIGGAISSPRIKDYVLKNSYRDAHFHYFDDGDVIRETLS
jgi:hypothetical protein